MGVILNILLFILKYLAGFLSGSVSITADAFNNLTDAVTVCLTMFGVKIASISPGKRHPEGHGRFEWIIALITSFSVVLVGWELLKQSIKSIMSPADMSFSWITLVILLFSIGVKIYLYFYHLKKSREQNLLSLKAVAIDSISDAASTAAVLCSLLLNTLLHWRLDGWFGLLVSFLIMYNSISVFGESVGNLMGNAPTQEKIDEILAVVNELISEPVPLFELKLIDNGCGSYTASFHLLSTETVSAEELVQSIPLIQKSLKLRYGYSSIIQVEEAADEKIKARMLNQVKDAMRNAGYTYELEQERVVCCKNNHYQLVGTVVVPSMDEKEFTTFNKFIEGEEALGFDDGNMLQIQLSMASSIEKRKRKHYNNKSKNDMV